MSSGDLGNEAHEFVDFLKEAGQSWWQMQTVQPTGEEVSPWSVRSAMAGDPYLISPGLLYEEGLLSRQDLRQQDESVPGPLSPLIRQRQREPLLRKAAARFYKDPVKSDSEEFAGFLEKNQDWLPDYALFEVLADIYNDSWWANWPIGFRLRKPEFLDQARIRYREEIRYHEFCQFLFFRQWQRLRKACHRAGIGLIGGFPVLLPYRCADVWVEQESFRLSRRQEPVAFPAGDSGDRALYHWDRMEKAGFPWWIRRIRKLRESFDVIYPDQFEYLRSSDEVAAGGRREMRKRRVPGRALLRTLEESLGILPLIASTFSAPSREMDELSEEFTLPVLHVMPRGFSRTRGAFRDRPHYFKRFSVVAPVRPGQETIREWYTDARKQRGNPEGSQDFPLIRETLGDSYGTVSDNLIRQSLASVASTAIIPLQEWLKLSGTYGPDTRLAKGDLSKKAARELYQATQAWDRTP